MRKFQEKRGKIIDWYRSWYFLVRVGLPSIPSDVPSVLLSVFRSRSGSSLQSDQYLPVQEISQQDEFFYLWYELFTTDLVQSEVERVVSFGILGLRLYFITVSVVYLSFNLLNLLYVFKDFLYFIVLSTNIIIISLNFR